MEKAQLDALLVAHGGRAQAVASLHVLRSPAISAADHAFLTEHASSLATLDLSRWLGHASQAQRPAVIDALAALARREPARFEFEIARAPHFQLAEAERNEIAVRLVGHVPEGLLAALLPQTGARPKRASAAPSALPSTPPAGAAASSALVDLSAAAPGDFFDPGDLLSDMDFDSALSADSRDGLSGADGLKGAVNGASDANGSEFDGASLDVAGLLGDGDFLGEGDFLGAGGPGEGAPAGDGAAADGASGGGLFGQGRSPALSALLAELPPAAKRSARAAWKKKALALAADTAEDWSAAVAALPAEMRDAALARAASSPRPEERAALLEWLSQNGVPKATLVKLTLELLASGDKAQGVRQWLAQSWIPRLLPDNASWSRHGAAVLSALAEQRAFSEMDELVTAVASGAGGLGPGLVALPGQASSSPDLVRAVASSLAKSLAASTKRALAGGQHKDALAGAAALACLGVPSPERAAVDTLRKSRKAKGEVATLLSLAHARARRPKDAPHVEDLIASIHALSDALS
jgi:hypothetical protein